MIICAYCGGFNDDDHRFCDQCGQSLTISPPENPPTEIVKPEAHPRTELLEPLPPATPAPATRRFVTPAVRLTFANGATLDLRDADEYNIGRSDPANNWYPAVDMTPHGGEAGGVSRRHARIYYQGTQPAVEDLGSTNRTYVNDKEIAPRRPQLLQDGDTLRIARVPVTFNLLTD